MQFVKHLTQYCSSSFLFLLFFQHTFSQCSPQSGVPPASLTFNTGIDASGGVRSGSAQDLNWKVAVNSITGTYDPAVVMSSYPSAYYNHSLLAYTWISFSATGTHSGNQDFFFKRDFTLPCFNLCGKSYNDDNVFCLDLTMFADNSVSEIYVNGVPQGKNSGLVPPPNPYSPPGIAGAVKTPVSVCRGWKAGNNSIIIKVSSSAIVTGLLIESSFRSPPLTDTLTASVCSGSVFQWRNKSYRQTGYYNDTVHLAVGCDSVRTLNLTVWPKSDTTIRQTICTGQSFAGYTAEGTYVDTLVSVTGCDSIRTIHLRTLSNPDPALSSNAAFCSGDSLVLSPGVFQSYLWQDGSTQSRYTVKTPGLYAVAVSNTCGSVRREIFVTEKTCNISFPNGFTPNGDGKNDLFKILTSYLFEEYYLSVFDRWGQKVFETTDPAKGWNGLYKDKPQQSGVFVWYCRFKRAGIVSSMKGSVLLIQ